MTMQQIRNNALTQLLKNSKYIIESIFEHGLHKKSAAQYRMDTNRHFSKVKLYILSHN